MSTENYANIIETSEGTEVVLEHYVVGSTYPKVKDTIIYFMVHDKEETIQELEGDKHLHELELAENVEFALTGQGVLNKYDFEDRIDALKKSDYQPIEYVTSKDSYNDVVAYLEKEGTLSRLEIDYILRDVFKPSVVVDTIRPYDYEDEPDLEP